MLSGHLYPILPSSLTVQSTFQITDEQIGTRERNKERKYIAKNKKQKGRKYIAKNKKEKGIKKENVLPKIRKRKE